MQTAANDAITNVKITIAARISALIPSLCSFADGREVVVVPM